MILVPLLNPKFAIDLAASCVANFGFGALASRAGSCGCACASAVVNPMGSAMIGGYLGAFVIQE